MTVKVWFVWMCFREKNSVLVGFAVSEMWFLNDIDQVYIYLQIIYIINNI